MNFNNIFYLTQNTQNFITSTCNQHKNSWWAIVHSLFLNQVFEIRCIFALTAHLDLDLPRFKCLVPTWGSWLSYWKLQRNCYGFQILLPRVPCCLWRRGFSQVVFIGHQRWAQLKFIIQHWAEPVPITGKEEGRGWSYQEVTCLWGLMHARSFAKGFTLC